MGNFDCWIDGQLGEFVERSICKFCLAFNISQTFSASAPSVLTVTGFNYDTCCDPKFGPSGNSQCPALRLIPLDIAWICIVLKCQGWDGVFNYDRCCFPKDDFVLFPKLCFPRLSKLFGCDTAAPGGIVVSGVKLARFHRVSPARCEL